MIRKSREIGILLRRNILVSQVDIQTIELYHQILDIQNLIEILKQEKYNITCKINKQ